MSEPQTLAQRLADLLRGETTFKVDDIAAVVDMSPRDPVFKLALHEAGDLLREEGIEFAPIFGNPGIRRRVEGATALERAKRFKRGAVRKLGRSEQQLSNINPNDLPSEQRRELQAAQDHTKRLLAASHGATQQGQETSTLLAKMAEPKPKKTG